MARGPGSSLSLILLAATGLSAACPARTASETRWQLDNGRLSASLSPRSAAIVGVERAGARTSFVNPAPAPEIVRLQFPIGLWNGHSALGSEAGGFKVRRTSRDSLIVTSQTVATAAGEFPIAMEIHYRLEGDNVVARLRVTNRSSHTLDQIVFPMLDLAPASDNSESISMTGFAAPLRQLFSQNTVRTQYDPFERLDPEDIRGWIHSEPTLSGKAFEYPSGFSLHSAWFNYQAGDFGVGWDIRDKSFQSQFAVIERVLVRDRHNAAANRQSYRVSWRWFPLIRPGESWETPDVYLRFTAGDWHQIAKQHRQWLQTWMPRPSVAPKLRTSIGWLSRGIHSYDQIPGIARTGVEVGAPYFILYGWYGSGMNGLSYNFLPQDILGGADSLRVNLRKARELGGFPLAWYNGTTTVEIAREHRELAHDWVVRNRDGGITVDGRWSLFDPDRPPGTDDTTILMNYDMGTAAAPFNIENVRRMIVDYGFSGFEMDQGAKNFLSYSMRDASKRPELSYTAGAREIYEASRRIVKENDPNGVVLGEGLSDFMNQYMDSSWTFEGGSLQLPVYTSYRYSLPWATLPAGVFTPERGYVNQAFMMNCPLDIFLDLTAVPEFVGHLKNLHRLKQAVHTFLYDGDFSDQDGFALHAPVDSAVLAKSYALPSGATAVVVINTGGQHQEATIDFADDAMRRATRYRLNGAIEKLPSSLGINLRMEPYDVNVLVTDRRQ